jgi:hypothetical protein
MARALSYGQDNTAAIRRAAQVAKGIGREIGPLPGRYAAGGEVPVNPVPEDSAQTLTAQPVVAPAPASPEQVRAPRSAPMAPRSAFAGYRNRLQADGDHPDRISQRTPKSAKGDNPITGNLMVDTASSAQGDKAHKHNVELLAQYPGMPAHLRQEGANHDEILHHFNNLAQGNLKFLHDTMPEHIRDRAKLWYKGGRRIVDSFAKRYNMPDSAVAGTLAALSPQKDWYQNVSLAERVLDALHRQHETHYTKEMEDHANRVFFEGRHDVSLDAIRGKKLADIEDPKHKAMFIRLHDEAHNPRWHRLVTPEGAFGRVRTKEDASTSDDEEEGAEPTEGDPSQTSWGSLSEISKAVQAAQSNGSKSALSRLMGDKHKVRNFYNNLLAPDAPHGDVTIDTHAVAANLLRPLGGSSTEVSHNFGTDTLDPHKRLVAAAKAKGLPEPVRTMAKPPAAKSSDLTGVSGTYPLHADAKRAAALQEGLLPREMQSITWEGIRGLFSPKQKRDRNLIAQVHGIWDNVTNGLLSAPEARQQILTLAGGMNEPSWARRSGDPDSEREWDSSYERGVPEGGAHGQPAAVAPGTGGGPSGAPSGLEPQEVDRFARARQLGRATRTAHGVAGRGRDGLPATYARRAGGSGAQQLAPDFGAAVRSTHDPHPEAKRVWDEAGISAPSMHELMPGARSGAVFHEAMLHAKGVGPHAAAVHAYDPKEYAGMKLFLSPDKATGFALKGDDIVSVFNNKARGNHRNVVNSLLDLAVQQGGRKLDAFDTTLPHLYSRNRFHAVSRLPFNDEFAPPGWDYDTFHHFNGGRPDVVHMAYDPNKHDFYNTREGDKVADYDAAVKKQTQAVKTYAKRIAKHASGGRKPAKKAYGGPVGVSGPVIDRALAAARHFREARA